MNDDFQLQLEHTFLSESDELIEQLENNLLELEKNPTNQDVIKDIFRSAHTLKGSSGMVGPDVIPNFIHIFETLLKSVLNDPDKPKDTFTFLLEQIDFIKTLITKFVREKLSIDDKIIKDNISKLENFGKSTNELIQDGEKFGFFEETKEHNLKQKESGYYRITFKIREKRFANTWLPEGIIGDLTELGKIVNITSIPSKKVSFKDLDTSQNYFGWIILLESSIVPSKIEDVFLFFRGNNENEIKIETLQKEDLTKLGEVLVSEGKIEKETLVKVIEEKKKIGEVLIEENKVDEKDINNALKVQEKLKKSISQDEEIKISTKKIDWLIDLVGELIIANSNLSNIQRKLEDLDLDQVQYNINKISRQMRDTILSLKMVPIGQLLTKYFRMVRDLSKEFGKEIILNLEGENTELDKSMFDMLQEPLLHLLRNSCDHGIESPEVRKKSNKPEEGKITIKSYHENGQIIMEISDDGRGLDRAKILEKAIKKGLLKDNSEYSDDEIYKVIFESGFSTKDNVSLISGRGVGMDAVLTGIKKLNGNIKIKTEMGVGTTFVIQLPLTLAIIEGFLLRVGVNHFVVPLSFLAECFEINTEDMKHKNMVYNLRNEYLSLIKLDDYFDNILYDDNKSNTKQAVVLTLANGGKLGILVDEIIGNLQAVIKPLNKVANKTNIITGSTLLGSGEVALILDITNLFEKFEESKK